MTPEVLVVELGSETMTFELTRTNRKTVGITVRPDSTLHVAAPLKAEVEDIVSRIRRRGSWILRTRRDFDRLRPRTPERRYISGETHRYLGRQYRLLVDPAQPNGVKLTPTHMVVGGLEVEETSRVRNRLQIWYQRQARLVMAERYAVCLRLLGLSPTTAPHLIVRPMEKRWGSLSQTRRRILLNRRLVEADDRLIDYVITHELCHLRHGDHGSEFLEALTDVMPDWRQRKARLERFML